MRDSKGKIDLVLKTAIVAAVFWVLFLLARAVHRPG